MRLDEAHEAAGGFWPEFWTIFTDPAHVLSEVAMSAIWDIVIITLIYQLLIKRWLYPRWSNKVHHEIDSEHGVDHNFAVRAREFESDFKNHVRVVEPSAAGKTSDAHGGG